MKPFANINHARGHARARLNNNVRPDHASPVKLLLILLSAASLCGCEIDRYTVILAVDAKDYRPSMKWNEIRKTSDSQPYAMHISDAEGRAIPLFRFMHESRSLMPLEEDLIHISTPIIVKKEYATFFLTISEPHGKELKKLRVDVRTLNAVRGGPTARAFPVDLR